MFRGLYAFSPAIALAALAVACGSAEAQRGPDHPRLRAALHELREARAELKSARDSWPPGYKERALRSINDAIESIRTILAVKNVDTFRGVDRNSDYYKRFKGGHPRLRAALGDLRDARRELATARADFGGRKVRALRDIDAAIADIVKLVEYRRP